LKKEKEEAVELITLCTIINLDSTASPDQAGTSPAFDQYHLVLDSLPLCSAQLTGSLVASQQQNTRATRLLDVYLDEGWAVP
jgi:hypothetical protein